MAVQKSIEVSAGHTYSFELRWETTPIVRVPISAITCPSGSAVVETSTAHGLLTGWRTAIVNVQQPKQINAIDPNKVRDAEYYPVTVTSPTTLELNTLNIGDLKPYTTDGFLQYNTPVDLAGVSLRFRLRARKGGALLASNLAADAPLDLLSAAVDTVTRKLTLTIPSTASTALAGKSGWYDVEAVSADTPPVVTPLVSGTFTVEKE